MPRENPQQQPTGAKQPHQPTETARRQPTEVGGQAAQTTPQPMEQHPETAMGGHPQMGSGQPQMGGGQTQMGGQPQMGGGQTQMGSQSQMGGQSQTGGKPGMGQQFQQRLSQRDRTALTAIAEAVEVCEWCADQCVQAANPDMIECIRLCEDVSELGEATLALTSRQSRYGQAVAKAFLQAVQACMQECGRHQAPHCQECARTLRRTAEQCEQLLRGASGQSPA